MPIKISVSGATEAREFVVGVPEKVSRRAILQMSQVAYDSMQRGANAHTKTGALFQSVYNRPTGTGSGREVGHDPQRAPHAIFVVFGTRPHEIRPRTKQVLRWPVGDGFAFAKRVNHPGYAGDDYMTRSAVAALDKLREIVDDIDLYT